MANTLITADMIAKEALMHFKNQLGFTSGANRQYDSQFAKKGAKVGNSIQIRQPQVFEAKDGKVAVIQNVTNKTLSLTLSNRKHVAFNFDSEELTLDIEQFSENYIKPAAIALANIVDSTGLELASESVYNAVGTPGTVPSDIDVYLEASQKLDEMACPVDDKRSALLSPRAQRGIVKGLSGLLSMGEVGEEQYRKGRMGYALGMDFAMAQNIDTHVVGAYTGTPLVDGASQSGSTLNIKGFGASITGCLKKGDIFTIAGVYALNPLTHKSTGSLKQFVVTADANSDGTGDMACSISPAINATATDPYRNVDALPADSAAITILGAASTSTPSNLVYHKDAFILGCADLELPRGVDMASRAVDKESGLSVRFVRQYDAGTDEWTSRLDIIFGWLVAHPEWAVRVQS